MLLPAACGYYPLGWEAASHAAGGAIAEGSVGAGTGASVGKIHGIARAIRGGIGTSSIRLDGGIVVGGSGEGGSCCASFSPVLARRQLPTRQERSRRAVLRETSKHACTWLGLDHDAVRRKIALLEKQGGGPARDAKGRERRTRRARRLRPRLNYIYGKKSAQSGRCLGRWRC
jgi:hypothetical protein